MDTAEEQFQQIGHQGTESKPRRRKIGFWSRIGGGSLTIAILVHVILLIAGAFIIFQYIQPTEKTVDFMPPGGGGGGGGSERGLEHEVKKKQRAQIIPSSNVKRVFAEGAVSNFSIPDPGDSFGEMSSLSSISGGGLSGGFGGAGTGDGLGNGTGGGKGDGKGLGFGGGGKGNPFGLIDSTVDALVGTFYDFKQTDDRKPTGLSNEQVKEVIRDFTNRGWKERSLSKFYKAPQTLRQNRIYIPKMGADAAPAAFGCEKEVQPSRWMVVYRGVVSPPATGRYRFVGAGDDVLVVRFNHRHVFDYGYTSGTTGIQLSGILPVLRGDTDNRDLAKKLKDFPMKLPLTLLQYDTTRNWNGDIGGLAVGPEFEAVAGRSYPIEILISEIPGGLFCASLLIEEVGKSGEKKPDGLPVLPLFRLDGSQPEPSKSDNAPPYDAEGPIWKFVSGGRDLDF